MWLKSENYKVGNEGARKSKVMVLNGEEELECEVHVDMICL